MLVQKPWPHELSSIISSNASAAAEYISWCDACFLADDSVVGVANDLSAVVHWDALEGCEVLAKGEEEFRLKDQSPPQWHHP